MRMEIMTPVQFLGDIIGDLNSRRARIEVVESYKDSSVVRCFVPLARTFGFVGDLRSLSQGRATHTMAFYRYEKVPADLEEQIMEVLVQYRAEYLGIEVPGPEMDKPKS